MGCSSPFLVCLDYLFFSLGHSVRLERVFVGKNWKQVWKAGPLCIFW